MQPDRVDRFPYIDGLRGVAVLAVLACHIVLIDFDGRGARVPRLWHPLSHGVDLFFAISGFCMAHIFWSGRRTSYGTFLVRRFVRIAPAFYIALLGFVALGHTPFGTPGLRSDGSDTLHSLFFAIPLSGARVNGAFWTIAVEARWYLIAPAAIVLYRRSPRAFLAVGFASYGLYAASPIFDDAGYLPCFMLGVLAADLRRRAHVVYRLAPLGVAALLPLALAMPQRGSNTWHAHPIWHLVAFALVLAGSQKFAARLLCWSPFRAVGAASYSIYLTHLPVLLWCGRHHVGLPAATGTALVAGFAFWALVERPFLRPEVRSAIERRIIASLEAVRSPPRAFGRIGRAEAATPSPSDTA